MRLLASLFALTFAIAAFAEDYPAAPRRTIVFGSCVHQDKPQPVWDAITTMHPDLFIFTGDNIYGDTKDMDVLRAKYKKLADNAGYQKLQKLCPIVATWDDHDYGWNDAGAEYPHRVESQSIFLDFFGIPKDSPLRARKGVYSSRTFGPTDKSVQIILLDTRYHRGPMRKRPRLVTGEGPYEANFDKTTTVLGEEQWTWLAEELKKPAKLRILVSSIQVISQDHSWEKWMNFPHERERLYKLLLESKAEGVVILSGDRHHGELSVADPGLSYPLFELTSSGLNQGFPKWRFPETNPQRISAMFSGNNFGAILIDWDKDDPIVRLQIRDEAGEVTIQEKIKLGLLKPGLMRSKAPTAPVAKLNGETYDPQRAKNLLNKEVVLEMHVAGSGTSKTGGLIFLDSSKDRNSTTNFTVVLDKKAQEGLKAADIETPRSHFEGKNIRVVGNLTLFRDQPQIVVSDAAKIQVVDAD